MTTSPSLEVMATSFFTLDQLKLETFPDGAQAAIRFRVGTSNNANDNIKLSGNTIQFFLDKHESEDTYQLRHEESEFPGDDDEYYLYSKFFFKDIHNAPTILLPVFEAKTIDVELFLKMISEDKPLFKSGDLKLSLVSKAYFIIGTDDERLGKAVKGASSFLMQKINGIDEQPFLVIKTDSGNSGMMEIWYSSI